MTTDFDIKNFFKDINREVNKQNDILPPLDSSQISFSKQYHSLIFEQLQPHQRYAIINLAYWQTLGISAKTLEEIAQQFYEHAKEKEYFFEQDGVIRHMVLPPKLSQAIIKKYHHSEEKYTYLQALQAIKKEFDVFTKKHNKQIWINRLSNTGFYFSSYVTSETRNTLGPPSGKIILTGRFVENSRHCIENLNPNNPLAPWMRIHIEKWKKQVEKEQAKNKEQIVPKNSSLFSQLKKYFPKNEDIKCLRALYATSYRQGFIFSLFHIYHQDNLPIQPKYSLKMNMKNKQITHEITFKTLTTCISLMPNEFRISFIEMLIVHYRFGHLAQFANQYAADTLNSLELVKNLAIPTDLLTLIDSYLTGDLFVFFPNIAPQSHDASWHDLSSPFDLRFIYIPRQTLKNPQAIQKKCTLKIPIDRFPNPSFFSPTTYDYSQEKLISLRKEIDKNLRKKTDKEIDNELDSDMNSDISKLGLVHSPL